MRKKVLVYGISLSLLLSGILAVVLGEAMDRGEELNGNVESGVDLAGLVNSPWSSFGRDRKNTGRSPHDTSHVDGTEKWNFTTNIIVFSSPAIDEDGTIYVGSGDNVSEKGKLYAITGEKPEEDDGIPGFTPTLLLVSAVISVAIYKKKKR